MTETDRKSKAKQKLIGSARRLVAGQAGLCRGRRRATDPAATPDSAGAPEEQVLGHDASRTGLAVLVEVALVRLGCFARVPGRMRHAGGMPLPATCQYEREDAAAVSDPRFDAGVPDVADAAGFLGIGRDRFRGRARGSARGAPLPDVVPAVPGRAQVTFIAMAEAHVLQALSTAGVRPSRSGRRLPA
jgi:hypothetical protein